MSGEVPWSPSALAACAAMRCSIPHACNASLESSLLVRVSATATERRYAHPWRNAYHRGTPQPHRVIQRLGALLHRPGGQHRQPMATQILRGPHGHPMGVDQTKQHPPAVLRQPYIGALQLPINTGASSPAAV